ncbi:MAG: hypothetical protein IKA87_10535, partial [Lentisphaeria bacterium]|nr:hypothetical protein [Lentisphaeria bacterium]
MSNYNYGLEPGIGHRNSSSKVRFVLIFLFVSAVTAAVLWYFWPREEKKINEKNVSSGTPEKILPAVETTLPEPEKKPADI